MKTIEEKAKAHDEALTKARMYRDNAKAAGDYAAVARYENIFPELAESEDERIYREIYSIVHHYYERQAGFFVSSPDKNEILEKWEKAKSFLEKQKKPEKIQRTGVCGFTDVVTAIRAVYNKKSADELVEYVTRLAMNTGRSR